MPAALYCELTVHMRLKAAKRAESPAAQLEQLNRIYQQTPVTAEGKTLTGLTEITAYSSRCLPPWMDLNLPIPSDLAKTDL
jgi:hypothetical protein